MAIGGGVGGLGLVGLLLTFVLNGLGGGGGFDVADALEGFGQAGQTTGSAPPANDDAAQFVAFVIDDVQATWEQLFQQSGRQYQPTTVVLFSQGTQTGCGSATSAVGPFYCPPDGKVYIDLTFFDELRSRFGAPGDFAQAYVIAHEVGHHVQNLLGINEDVRRRQQEDPDGANELSVLLELQADCFAGVWGSSAAERGILEPGDLEEGIAAAAAVGDDRLQREATGQVDTESFTHGSSEQRTAWFRRGFDTGDPGRCDTFAEGPDGA
jgi:predicted metalloprotease